MNHAAQNAARPDDVKPRSRARADIVLAVSDVLAEPGVALAGLTSVLARAGCSEDEIRSTFGSVDDLAVALAEHEAFLISQPLARQGPAHTLDEARDALIAFGDAAWTAYSTKLVGFVRLMMVEGARNPVLKKRMYEAGPAVVTSKLREFLSDAHERGIFSIANVELFAEQLMGLLREPLYQALLLSPPTNQERAGADRVRDRIDGFVHGCASTRRAAS
jgi:DHA2 family multidrug resistance protein